MEVEGTDPSPAMSAGRIVDSSAVATSKLFPLSFAWHTQAGPESGADPRVRQQSEFDGLE